MKSLLGPNKLEKVFLPDWMKWLVASRFVLCAVCPWNTKAHVMKQASKAENAIHQLIEELRSDYYSLIVKIFGKYSASPPKLPSLITRLVYTDRSMKWQDAAATEGEIWQKHPVRHVYLVLCALLTRLYLVALESVKFLTVQMIPVLTRHNSSI